MVPSKRVLFLLTRLAVLKEWVPNFLPFCWWVFGIPFWLKVKENVHLLDGCGGHSVSNCVFLVEMVILTRILIPFKGSFLKWRTIMYAMCVYLIIWLWADIVITITYLSIVLDEVLENHILDGGIHRVTGEECEALCLQNLRCLSFNFKQKTENERDVFNCILNGATREMDPASYKKSKGWIYYMIKG